MTLRDRVQIPPATRHIALPSPFPMRRGGVLTGATLAYERWGELSPARDNVVVILTGLSPSAHAASSPEDPSTGWWEQIIGPAKAIDTQRWHVICFNSLGSCKGSTGPASINPATGRPYRLDFPDLSVEDIAAAVGAALDAMGIGEVRAVIGPSMGGMSILAFVGLYPGRAPNLLSVSSAAGCDPFAIGIRSLQRELIWSDPGFANGDYGDVREVLNGMRLARKLGVLSYRGAEEFRFRFGRQRIAPERRKPGRFAPEFEIERYLDGHADRFSPNFDPVCYLQLSRAMDWFDFAEHGDGDLVEAARRSGVRHAGVIGVTTDILFPLSAQEELAQAFREAGATVQFAALPSPQAHDAFLVDMERFAPQIARFMRVCRG